MQLKETEQIKEVDLIDWVNRNCDKSIALELEEKICAIYPFLDAVECEIKNSVYYACQNREPEVTGEIFPQPILVFTGKDFKKIVYGSEYMVLFIDYDTNCVGGEPDQYFNLEEAINFRNTEFIASYFLEVCGKHAFDRVFNSYAIYANKLDELESYIISRFVDMIKPTL